MKHIYPEKLERLFIKYAAGELSSDEYEKLEQWLSLAPENKQILELLEGHSPYGSDIKQMFDYDRDRVWNVIVEAELKRINKKKKNLRIIAYTAAACFLFGLLYVAKNHHHWETNTIGNELYTLFEPGAKNATIRLADGRTVDMSDDNIDKTIEIGCAVMEISDEGLDFHLNDNAEQTGSEYSYNTLYVPTGAEFTLKLSDGTKVWLNSESSIKFPAIFAKPTRDVEITGEAYFEVAENKEKPFVVRFGGQTVTVLGTEFNISAYANENITQTTLISGSITLAVEGRDFLLSPNQQLSYDRDKGTATISTVDARLYNAWVNGMFVFFDEPLTSICSKLARWYGVEVDTSSPTLQGVRYSGIILRQNTFNKVAELLSETGEIFFREAHGKIYVTVRK